MYISPNFQNPDEAQQYKATYELQEGVYNAEAH